jgi:hypothetical protein
MRAATLDDLGAGVAEPDRGYQGLVEVAALVRPFHRSGDADRAGYTALRTRAAADSGIGSYRTNERVNEPEPCDSERRSMA